MMGQWIEVTKTHLTKKKQVHRETMHQGRTKRVFDGGGGYTG